MEKCKRCKADYDPDQDDKRNQSGFCLSCLVTEVGPKRLKRSLDAYYSRQRINEVYAEMRAAIAERDKYRREAEQMKAKIRQEAIEAMVVGGFI